MGRTTKDFILRRVIYDQRTKCWIWTGPKNGAGYPCANRKLAHREAYELWIGPIPEDHDLDHTCTILHFGNRYSGNLCVNPQHLKPVTRSEHNYLTYVRRRGQMPARRLRKSRALHNQVTDGILRGRASR